MDKDSERLVALEMRHAEQERVIEDLSAQLAQQWKEIERLRASFDVLAERFRAVEENAAPDVPITKPPHW